MTNNCGVYKIANTLTGDFYIGSSINLLKRFKEHQNRLIGNRHKNAHLQNAWNKYGEDKFSFEVILYCDKSMILYYEQVLIDGLKPTYNIAKNAAAPMLGCKHTDETRQKISETKNGRPNPVAVGNQNFLGHHHTEETKQKISEALKDRIVTEETKRKLGKTKIGNTNMLGKHHTAETRAKLSAIRKGKPNGRLGKHHTEETKRKISEAKKGRVIVTEETKQKISEANSGERNPNFGKHLSEETKRKISEARKGECGYWFGKHLPEETKRKLSEALKGRNLTEEHKRKLSEASRRAWAKRKAEAI